MQLYYCTVAQYNFVMSEGVNFMPLWPGAGVGHSESLELGSVSTVSASFSLYSPSDASSQLVAWSAFLRLLQT